MTRGLPLAKTWDANLHQLGGSILQGSAWAAFQAGLGRNLVRDEGDGWQWLGVERGSHGLKYIFCPYGPLALNEVKLQTAVTSLVTAAQEMGVDFVRLEPPSLAADRALSAHNAQRIGDVEPQHTQVIDLTKSVDELRSQLASGHRNLINGTQRRGITISEMTNAQGLAALLDMLKSTARRSGVVFYPDSYYQTMLKAMPEVSTLYLAKVLDEPIAAALFYDWDGTRYYAHAGAYQEKNRQLKASVSLVWQAIIDAKAKGLQKFDLWGVAPEDQPGHQLTSLSKFKRAFGGTPVTYSGTWDIPLKPAKYQAYNLYRKLRGRH